MAEKEAHLEREYKDKAQDMKDNLQQIKKKFEDRCEEFRKQMVEYKTNNEAIEALRKAHAKELAAHVQEHNKKYSDLLQAKLDSEDQLKEQAEKDKAKLAQDWQQKLTRAVDENQRVMTVENNRKLKEQKESYEVQLESLRATITGLNEDIVGLQKKLKERDLTI